MNLRKRECKLCGKMVGASHFRGGVACQMKKDREVAKAALVSARKAPPVHLHVGLRHSACGRDLVGSHSRLTRIRGDVTCRSCLRAMGPTEASKRRGAEADSLAMVHRQMREDSAKRARLDADRKAEPLTHLSAPHVADGSCRTVGPAQHHVDRERRAAEAGGCVTPDCRTCGLCCCASEDLPSVPDVDERDLVRLGPSFARRHVRNGAIETRWLKATTGPHAGLEFCACAALRGSPGGRVSCSIYGRRPAVCRESIQPGDSACLQTRRKWTETIESLSSEAT